jgi:hypothetical protein
VSTAVEAPTVWGIAVDDAPVSVSARGDLIAVAGAEGTVRVEEHTEHGTRLVAKVSPELAGQLAEHIAVG